MSRIESWDPPTSKEQVEIKEPEKMMGFLKRKETGEEVVRVCY